MTPDGDPSRSSEGRLAVLGPGAIASALSVGLVLGWLLRRLAAWTERPVPVVTWTQALVLFFCGAILGVLLRHTRRVLAGALPRPEAHRLVNRLVLARASALVGALVTGGYAGHALSWLGVGTEIAGERIARSGLAGLGGLVVLVMALLLERACRVSEPADPA